MQKLILLVLVFVIHVCSADEADVFSRISGVDWTVSDTGKNCRGQKFPNYGIGIFSDGTVYKGVKSNKIKCIQSVRGLSGNMNGNMTAQVFRGVEKSILSLPYVFDVSTNKHANGVAVHYSLRDGRYVSVCVSARIGDDPCTNNWMATLMLFDSNNLKDDHPRGLDSVFGVRFGEKLDHRKAVGDRVVIFPKEKFLEYNQYAAILSPTGRVGHTISAMATTDGSTEAAILADVTARTIERRYNIKMYPSRMNGFDYCSVGRVRSADTFGHDVDVMIGWGLNNGSVLIMFVDTSEKLNADIERFVLVTNAEEKAIERGASELE